MKFVVILLSLVIVSGCGGINKILKNKDPHYKLRMAEQYYVKKKYNLMIGERTAERIKIEIGSAMLTKSSTMEVKGRDLVTGVPKTITLSAPEVNEALLETIANIVEVVRVALENTPPELVSDIYEHGIVLTGGGALLRGLDKEIAQATKIPVRVADDPLTCVVRGTGILLSDPELLAKVMSPGTQQY